MSGFLLDTNHLSEAIRKVSRLRDRIRQEHRSGQRFATCWAALCELEAGIVHLHNQESFRRTLRLLLKEVRIWPTDWDTVRVYGELFSTMKKIGRRMSHVDLVLASFAQHRNVTVLTDDHDFDDVPGIRTENWLV